MQKSLFVSLHALFNSSGSQRHPGTAWHGTWVLTGSVETKGVPLFYAEIAGDSCLLNLQPLLLSVSSVHRRWGPGFQQQQGRLCPLPLFYNAGYRPLRALVLT